MEPDAPGIGSDLMLHETTLLGETDKVAIAVERLWMHCPPEGYYLAFSGGKDSIVLKRLADMACVPYDAHFNMTTVDPPEVIKFIREYHPDVERHRPEESMWQLIIRKGMPPTRRVRYCCEILKERGGIGRVVLTGIRWEESSQRKKRSMVHTCYKHATKSYLHPIIDWSKEDVWEFIKSEGLPYCSLYDEGFKRIGCVLCPLYRGRKADIKRWPNFYNAYMRTFEKMLEARKVKGLKTDRWNTAQDVMDWWLDDDKVKYDSRQQVFSIFE